MKQHIIFAAKVLGVVAASEALGISAFLRTQIEKIKNPVATGQ